MSQNAKKVVAGSDCSSKWASEDLGIDESYSNVGANKVAKEQAKAKAQAAHTGGLRVSYDPKKADEKK
jgi:hypothetical protein